MNTVKDLGLAGMPDVQSGYDQRDMPIQRVGVRGLRYPVLIAGQQQAQPSVADVEMTIALSAQEKGTHMSRFVKLLDDYRNQALSPHDLAAMANNMLKLLQAEEGDIKLQFTYFMQKYAPVSGQASLMDYQLGWQAKARLGQPVSFTLTAQVPVTSLCPCSKAISQYGAHNQRSCVSVSLHFSGAPSIGQDELIRLVESQASCELWGLLKRSDEKYVTERAYENPKFVEDLVRDVAGALKKLPGLLGYKVEAENFESIHNHSAYAMVCA